MNEERKRE